MNRASFRKLISLSLLALIAALPLPSAFAQQSTSPLNNHYQKWLDEDVRWIISDAERADFTSLRTDEQRDHYIVAFWERRNPTTGAPENAFKEEHYRRLAYANERFAESVPGYQTDRGHTYIKYGPPDQVDNHPNTQHSGPAQIEPAGSKPHPAFEVWYYRYIEGMGSDVIIEFVDDCQCGQYHMTVRHPKKKPGASGNLVPG